MSLKIGALFAGYGGLDLAVSQVLDAEAVWFSEFDKGPSKILEHRFPGVPNHGDITKIDWSQVEPVDIITGGSPCQDLSHAGARRGMTEGTRSNLWVAMREAIAALRPSLVVWENVRGAYSAEATSGLVDDPRLLADTRRRDGEPVLRALGRVLGDLSDLGYDASWHGLRAADVGAPHGRFRVFVVAHATSDKGRLQHGDGGLAAIASGLRRDAGWSAGPREADSGRASADLAGRGDAPLTRAQVFSGDWGDWPSDEVAVPPTPTTRDWKDHTIRREPHRPDDMDTLARALTVTLLPTPAVNDMGAAYTPETWDAWCEAQKAKHGNGNGHGKSLHVEAARLVDGGEWWTEEDARQAREQDDIEDIQLLPTPRTRNNENRQSEGYGGKDGNFHGLVNGLSSWGQYADAIQRWEQLTRPAPAPTELGPKGNPRLSAAFSEWMMGLPAGWVTDVPGITRNEALKALGNGVVPAQAVAALRFMLGATVMGDVA
jgi:DNA (cytosine-5)-methyltransferase 1